MGKIAVLFPGQGAQFVGMGRQLIAQLPEARQLFQRAEKILGYDLAEICQQGPREKLDSTVYSQPALFVASLAAVERLRRDGAHIVEACQAAAGLSLGEYTALVFAGAIDFESGLKIVQARGQAMQQAAEAVASGMVSILGADVAEVNRLCEAARYEGEILQIANLLCPGNTVVSGERRSCQRLVLLVSQRSFKGVPLAVAGAFHTPLMQPAVDRLAQVLANVPIETPRIPVISNVDAQPHSEPAEIRRLLIQQVVQPVLWEQSMQTLLADGFDTFCEVGPGRVLRGLLRRVDRTVDCHSVAAD